eukprot:TRINITY_DN7676_c0_g1_i2.p4 TRINITY_DN7676_c0_g1~~TRINITY_DN7676_c0_g1_i2.p4  ORF type:complete len:114 (+),score=13.82 TRINITY_DN7676_c0_g1_i2:100-441(+)
MIRRPPRSTLSSSSAASDVYKRQGINAEYGEQVGQLQAVGCAGWGWSMHVRGRCDLLAIGGHAPLWSRSRQAPWVREACRPPFAAPSTQPNTRVRTRTRELRCPLPRVLSSPM